MEHVEHEIKQEMEHEIKQEMEHEMDLNNLPEKTRSVLQALADQSFMERFTLVGGTALSLQIGHRQSEDLDFIFDGDKVDDTAILRFIDSKFQNEYKVVKQDFGYQLDLVIRGIKVTFFSTSAIMVHFKVKEYSTQYRQLNIARPDIIGVLKMVAIAHRNTIRDYFDLYYLSKHHVPLADTISLTRELVSGLAPITYTETILFVDDLEENSIAVHLQPKEVVTKQQMAEFLTHEVRRIHDR